MISIKGILVKSISIDRDENGKNTVQGAYHLMSSNDAVLAKQSFNGYSDIKIEMSAETLKSLREFTTALRADLENTLGLVEKGA